MAEDKDYLEQEEENKEDYENVCFICRRPESKAGKMIDIPGGIHVCMDCMQKSFNSMNICRWITVNYEKHAQHHWD